MNGMNDKAHVHMHIYAPTCVHRYQIAWKNVFLLNREMGTMDDVEVKMLHVHNHGIYAPRVDRPWQGTPKCTQAHSCTHMNLHTRTTHTDTRARAHAHTHTHTLVSAW